MLEVFEKRNTSNKNNSTHLKPVIAAALAAVLAGAVYYESKQVFSEGEVKEYTINKESNSVIRLLQNEILNERQRNDGVLCYKLAKFVMEDNGIKDPRKLQSGTNIKINMKEIYRIIEEHEKGKEGTEEEIENERDDYDIYEEKQDLQGVDKELEEMIDRDVEQEDEREIIAAVNQRERNNIGLGRIEPMKCKGGEYFGIDVSKFNMKLSAPKLLRINRKKRDSKKKDVRGISFIYIRAADGLTKDIHCDHDVNVIRQYNSNATVIKNNEKIAVGFYHRISNAGTGVVQANEFVKIYRRNTGITNGNTLIPMLDIEGGWMNAHSSEGVKQKALAWLQTVENELHVTPGLYLTPSIYRTYFYSDARFKKYQVWLAAYPPKDKNGKEIGKSKRLDTTKGTVDIGTQKRQIVVKPACYQSSEQGLIEGTGNSRGYTDMDHSKDLTPLFTQSNVFNGKNTVIREVNPKVGVTKPVAASQKKKAVLKKKNKKRMEKASRSVNAKNKKNVKPLKKAKTKKKKR